MSHLRGVAFDRAYAANELRYHRAVNGLVATTFIPKIANKDAKAAFEGALVIFTAHEQHAEMMVKAVGGSVARGTGCSRAEAARAVSVEICALTYTCAQLRVRTGDTVHCQHHPTMTASIEVVP